MLVWKCLKNSQNHFLSHPGFFIGEVTLCQSDGKYLIVTWFLPPVVGCLLKKAYKRKGGHGHPRTTLAMPLVMPFGQSLGTA